MFLSPRRFMPPLCTLCALALPGAAAQAQDERSAQTAPDPMQTVVVTATRHAMALVDAPAAMSVVTPQQIAERGADNLLEALRGETGLSLIGRTISGRRNISLRGMDGRHTLFLVDGKRIGNTDGVIGHSDFQYDWVGAEDIARIEVLRGPMSVLYGAEALGGVVNVLTRAPGLVWGGRALVEGTVANGGLGGDGSRLAAQVSGPLRPDLRLSLSATDSRRQALASAADAGVDDIEGHHKQSGALRLLWTAAPGHELQLDLADGREKRWAGMLERSGKRRYYQSDSLITRQHEALSWAADWGGAHALRSQLRAYASQAAMDNSRSNGVTALRANALDDQVLDGQLSGELAGGALLTGGFEARLERLDNSALAGATAAARHQALFGQGEWQIGRTLAVTAGLRHDAHDRFGHAWSPRLYAVWRPAASWVLKGGVGDGFKAPTLKQISPGYREDEGPYTFFSNPALQPERNRAVELGLGWDTPALGWQAMVFHNRVTDLVVPRLMGVVSSRAQYVFENIDRARLQGLEISGRATWASGWSVEANSTWLDATDGNGVRLEKRPRWTLAVALGWRQGPWSAGVRAERQAGLLIATTSTTQPLQPLPDLTRMSAHLSRRLGPQLELQLGVDNLTGLRLSEQSPLFTWAEPPRSWRLALRGQW